MPFVRNLFPQSGSEAGFDMLGNLRDIVKNVKTRYLPVTKKQAWWRRLLRHYDYPIVGLYAKGTNNAFGLNGDLPWPKNKIDMAYFKALTDGAVVIMGWNTYMSLPETHRPLPNRLNIVVASAIGNYNDEFSEPNLKHATSLKQALRIAKTKAKPIFVIGGAQLLNSALPYCDLISITSIPYDSEFDVGAPHHDVKNTTPVLIYQSRGAEWRGTYITIYTNDKPKQLS